MVKKKELSAHILVIDDEIDLIDVIEQIFSEEIFTGEYEFDSAFDGEMAWEKIQKETPDLLLLDINMPNLDGLSLLHQLNEEGIEVKTIVISAYDRRENFEKAFAEHAFDFLVKPFTSDDLRKKIEEALEKEKKAKKIGLWKVSVFANKLTKRQVEQLIEKSINKLDSHQLKSLEKKIKALISTVEQEEKKIELLKLKDKSRIEKGLIPFSILQKSTIEIKQDKYLVARWTDAKSKKLLSHSFTKEDLADLNVKKIIEQKLLKNKKIKPEELKSLYAFYS